MIKVVRVVNSNEYAFVVPLPGLPSVVVDSRTVSRCTSVEELWELLLPLLQKNDIKQLNVFGIFDDMAYINE